MDPKLKAWYLDCDGTFCPFCGSGDISDKQGVPDGGNFFIVNVSCNNCLDEWQDVVCGTTLELMEVRYVPGDDRANEKVPVPASASPAERDRARRE